MVNYNPETVSTDYDICDRLYFDELSFERVLDILDPRVRMGWLCPPAARFPTTSPLRLDQAGVRLLGTSAQNIDNAEDREKFSAMLGRIGVTSRNGAR